MKATLSLAFVFFYISLLSQRFIGIDHAPFGDPNVMLKEFNALDNNYLKHDFKSKTEIEYSSYDSLNPSKNIISARRTFCNNHGFTITDIDNQIKDKTYDSTVFAYIYNDKVSESKSYNNNGCRYEVYEYDGKGRITHFDSHWLKNGISLQSIKNATTDFNPGSFRFRVSYNAAGLVQELVTWGENPDGYWNSATRPDPSPLVHRYFYNKDKKPIRIIVGYGTDEIDSDLITYNNKQQIVSDEYYINDQPQVLMMYTYESDGSSRQKLFIKDDSTHKLTFFSESVCDKFNNQFFYKDGSSLVKAELKYINDKLSEVRVNERKVEEPSKVNVDSTATIYSYDGNGNKIREVSNSDVTEMGTVYIRWGVFHGDYMVTTWKYNQRNKVIEEKILDSTQNKSVQTHFYKYYEGDTIIKEETSTGIDYIQLDHDSKLGENYTIRYNRHGDIIYESGPYDNSSIKVYKYQYS